MMVLNGLKRHFFSLDFCLVFALGAPLAGTSQRMLVLR